MILFINFTPLEARSNERCPERTVGVLKSLFQLNDDSKLATRLDTKKFFLSSRDEQAAALKKIGIETKFTQVNEINVERKKITLEALEILVPDSDVKNADNFLVRALQRVKQLGVIQSQSSQNAREIKFIVRLSDENISYFATFNPVTNSVIIGKDAFKRYLETGNIDYVFKHEFRHAVKSQAERANPAWFVAFDAGSEDRRYIPIAHYENYLHAQELYNHSLDVKDATRIRAMSDPIFERGNAALTDGEVKALKSYFETLNLSEVPLQRVQEMDVWLEVANQKLDEIVRKNTAFSYRIDPLKGEVIYPLNLQNAGEPGSKIVDAKFVCARCKELGTENIGRLMRTEFPMAEQKGFSGLLKEALATGNFSELEKRRLMDPEVDSYVRKAESMRKDIVIQIHEDAKEQLSYLKSHSSAQAIQGKVIESARAQLQSALFSNAKISRAEMKPQFNQYLKSINDFSADFVKRTAPVRFGENGEKIGVELIPHGYSPNELMRVGGSSGSEWITKEIQLERQADKDLRKVQKVIAKSFFDWKEKVETEGLANVRKIPGYHDEPLSDGTRSVRLNQRYRALYVLEGAGDHKVVRVLKIDDHSKSYGK